MKIVMTIPFSKWGNLGPNKLSNLPKLVSDLAGIQQHAPEYAVRYCFSNTQDTVLGTVKDIGLQIPVGLSHERSI